MGGDEAHQRRLGRAVVDGAGGHRYGKAKAGTSPRDHAPDGWSQGLAEASVKAEESNVLYQPRARYHTMDRVNEHMSFLLMWEAYGPKTVASEGTQEVGGMRSAKQRWSPRRLGGPAAWWPSCDSSLKTESYEGIMLAE